MPLYVYKCPKCGYSIEETRTVERRDESPLCYGRLPNGDGSGRLHLLRVMERDLSPGHSFRMGGAS